MLILLCAISIIAIALFIILIIVVKIKPESAVKVEMIGYLFLTISLSWGFVVSETADIANGQSDVILNEKLNMLWNFEREKAKKTEVNDNLELYYKHYDLNSNWYFLDSSGNWVNTQEEFANRTQYIIAGVSTICIASGRIGEMYISKGKKRSVVKGVYRNSRKRRGKIK